MKKLVLVLGIIALIMAPPFILKDRKGTPLVGPRLQELNHRDVSFHNGDLSLSGMLFLPLGNGPFPAAVFIQGSGASIRDNKWYLSVAKQLQENGIAVLIPDKRGSERSGGDWSTATFYDLAGDAASAVDFIDAQPMFEHSRIGVIGFSQGGWIAPIVATEDRKVAFVVSMSGPGVTTDEQLSHEVVNDIADSGTYHFVGKLLSPIGVYMVKRNEFWHFIGGFDPIPYWQKVNVPSFMAFGEGDKNVPVRESVKRVQALKKSNITVRMYPRGGHAIIDPATHRVQQQYLDDLTDFIREVKAT